MPNNVDYRFLCAAMNPQGRELGNLFARYSKTLDWDWLLTFSQKNKISGILIESLNRAEITERVPSETQNALDLILAKAHEQTERAYKTLDQLATALDQEHIPFLVLKGSVFAEELYRHASLRPFYDVDLLVHRRFLKKAEDVLTSIGYSFYYPANPAKLDFVPLRYRLKKNGGNAFSESTARRFYLRYHFHFPFVLPWDDKRLPIDLHWDIFPPGFPSMDFWQYNRELTIGNRHLRTLTVETTIVYLAFVIAKKGILACNLLALCDFIRYVNSSNLTYQPGLLWEIADKMGARRYVEVSLSFANRLLNDDVSPPLKLTYKKNFLSACLLYPATCKSLIFKQPRRIALWQKILANSFWELALCQFPRRSLTSLVLGLIEYLAKIKLLKHGFK